MTADARAHPSSSRRRSLGALVAAIGVVLVLTGASACSGKESTASSASTLDDGSSQSTAPSVTFFTDAQADPAGPVTVSVGQQFAIVLLAEPATGYSWQPVSTADPIVLLTVGTEFRGPGEAYPDSPETQILRYVGRAVGTAQISLHYSRPAAAAPEDRIVTFTVNVIDPNAPTTTTLPPDTGSTDTTATTAAPRSTTTTKARSTTTTKARSTTTTTKATTTTPTT